MTWSSSRWANNWRSSRWGCCGSHLGYHNKMVLANLILHVAPMPPTKFWLNLTYHSGADEVWRFSRWPPWGPSLISEQKDFFQFWISMSLQCLPLSLGSICTSVLEAMSFKEFQDSHLWCWNRTNLAVLNLHVSPMPPTKFQLNPNYPSGTGVVSRFSNWPPWRSS